MRSKRLPHPFSQEELSRLAPVLRERPALESVCTFLLETGLRSAEFAALTVAEARTWPVPRWYRRDHAFLRIIGKGGVERIIPLTPDALRAAQVLLRYAEGPRLSPWSERGLRWLLANVSTRSGVHCHAHRYRHTFASRLINKGVDPFIVADLLGHASLDTTRIYSRLDQRRLESAFR